MPDSEIVFLSAVEQGRLLRELELSPVELMRAYLERIERYDGTLRAYITVCAVQALTAARQAEREIVAGNYRGPLHGIPFGVKDQLCTKGIRTTLGSRIMSGYVPDHDATVITRLRAAGAILIGKENLHEFGKGGTNIFPFGQPRNPWNIAHTPAGSSSGSAIAVAAGFCSGSLGEDTGGSVRSPAAANGVVGLRLGQWYLLIGQRGQAVVIHRNFKATSPQDIEGTVTRHGQHPAGGRATFCMIFAGVMPNAHESILQNFLGQILAPQQTHAQAINTRRHGVVKASEGALVTACDPSEQHHQLCFPDHDGTPCKYIPIRYGSGCGLDAAEKCFFSLHLKIPAAT